MMLLKQTHSSLSSSIFLSCINVRPVQVAMNLWAFTLCEPSCLHYFANSQIQSYFCLSCCNAEHKDTEGYTWISQAIKKAWGCTPRLPACIGIMSKPDTITASDIQTFSFHGAVIIAQIKMSHEAMALLHHIYRADFKRLFTLRKKVWANDEELCCSLTLADECEVTVWIEYG